MPKKPTKKDKKFVQDFFEELQWFFGVQNYDREIAIEKEALDDPGITAWADIVIEEDDQRVRVRIYPPFWELTRNLQCKTPLHELCHVMTNPLKEAVDDLIDGKLITPEARRIAIEKSTSMVENALHSLLSGRSKYATEAYKKWLKH